jgi:hypothetical protein
MSAEVRKAYTTSVHTFAMFICTSYGRHARRVRSYVVHHRQSQRRRRVEVDGVKSAAQAMHREPFLKSEWSDE